MSVSVFCCVTVGECVCLSESDCINVCIHVSVNECECMPECVRYAYEPLCVYLSMY